MSLNHNSSLQLFRNDPENKPLIYAVWSYGLLAIPAAKFSVEEALFAPPENTSLIVRATISNAVVLAGFSVMSAMYGYFGHSKDFLLSGEYGFRFALKYICVLEPARMLCRLCGPYLLGRK
eukprot:gene2647-2813_t